MKAKSESEVAQSCLTIHDPMDCSLPGSSVHGIFQAKVLEWGATAFSTRGLEWGAIAFSPEDEWINRHMRSLEYYSLGGMGVGEGREAREGRAVCIIMADLHGCMAEITQHCKNFKVYLKKEMSY